MYFNKYYSFKTKEYIHKIILNEYELKVLREVINTNMEEIDYNKLLIKRFDIDNEYKFSKSPNFIGFDVLEKIKETNLRHYTIELTDNELFELFEYTMKLTVRFADMNKKLHENIDATLAQIGYSIEEQNT